MARPTPIQYYYLTLLAGFTAIGGIIIIFTIIIGVTDFIYFYHGNGPWIALACSAMAAVGYLVMRTAWRVSQRYQARIENSN
jgi:hypothetical protein